MPKQSSKAASHFDTLFGVQQGEQLASGFKLISREKIERAAQPRQSFPAAEIGELADSIAVLRERGEGIAGTGILQPLLVTQNETGYRLIAGERRYRASEQAGVEQLPVIVVAAHENGNLLAQLVENLQRRDLPPLEEAQGIAQLMAEQNVSLRETARLLGKGKGYIENRVNLLKMKPDVQEMVSVQTDTLLHARDIEAITDAKLRSALIHAVLEEGISRAELRRRIESGRTENNQVDNQQPQPQPDQGEQNKDQKSDATQTSHSAPLSVRTDSDRSDNSSADGSSTGGSSAKHDSVTLPRGKDTNKDADNVPQDAGATSDDNTTTSDPLLSALRPAVAFAAEFGRQVQTVKLTCKYRQAVIRELDLLRHEIALIEMKLDSENSE